jgi:4,5-dihydroxyphthalate decarboxylase
VALLELTLAVGRYAITEALLDGSVEPQGTRVRALAMPSPERHWRMLRHREFDVCELSLAGYVQALAREPERWSAIPVFPHRRYRHGYVFVSTDFGGRRPEDLAGSRIGLRTWATTAGVWMRGILQDEYGLDLHSVHWLCEHAEHVSGRRRTGFAIEQVTDGKPLPELLAEQELQALIYPERLSGPDVRPLFADPAAEERAYAERTGLFPIMHLVAVRRELLEAHPWLGWEFVTAFEKAKAAAYARASNPRWLPLAWGEQALAEQRAVLGDDPWRSGLTANVRELEALLRYCREQDLLDRDLAPPDLFWPSTHDHPPVYASTS